MRSIDAPVTGESCIIFNPLDQKKTMTLDSFLADLLHFFFFLLILFSLLFMLRICSGYLGCGLHYGRNGSPQNPFSRKGLYPWAACSSVWHFLWKHEKNKKHKQHTQKKVCRLFKPLAPSNGDHMCDASNYRNSISRICVTPQLCIHPPARSSYTHLSSRTVASSTMFTWKKTWNRI